MKTMGVKMSGEARRRGRERAWVRDLMDSLGQRRGGRSEVEERGVGGFES